MIYRTFQGKQLSLLGFGTMRLPQTQQGEIDSGPPGRNEEERCGSRRNQGLHQNSQAV